MPVYDIERYNRLVEDTFAEIIKLGKLKGGEYAGDFDRLANFRRNGEKLGLPMEVVWAVYVNKHLDAIIQYVQDRLHNKDRKRLESLAGRVDDAIVYLLLFKAMLDETNENQQ